MRYLETAELPTDELTPYPGNPRRGHVEKIRASLRANGQYRAIVVRRHRNGRHTVLAGNHTWRAAHEEALPAIRSDVYECTTAEAARIVAWDNRGDDLAAVDQRALGDLIGHLLGNLEGTGYSPADADDLFAALEEADRDGVPGEGYEHAGHYAPASARALVLELPLPRFTWVEEQLAQIRQERGLDSNSAAAVHVLAAVTGRTAPA
jgi:ParB-like chromosome segregation protein Spo0J